MRSRNFAVSFGRVIALLVLTLTFAALAFAQMWDPVPESSRDTASAFDRYLVEVDRFFVEYDDESATVDFDILVEVRSSSDVRMKVEIRSEGESLGQWASVGFRGRTGYGWSCYPVTVSEVRSGSVHFEYRTDAIVSSASFASLPQDAGGEMGASSEIRWDLATLADTNLGSTAPPPTGLFGVNCLMSTSGLGTSGLVVLPKSELQISGSYFTLLTPTVVRLNGSLLRPELDFRLGGDLLLSWSNLPMAQAGNYLTLCDDCSAERSSFGGEFSFRDMAAVSNRQILSAALLLPAGALAGFTLESFIELVAGQGKPKKKQKKKSDLEHKTKTAPRKSTSKKTGGQNRKKSASERKWASSIGD